MNYFIIGYLATIILMVSRLIFSDKRKSPDQEKYFDDLTAKFIMGIMLSVIVSFAISMSTNIPEGAGLGGLLWLFGPIFSGIISAWVYVFAMMISVKLKIYTGWACIIFNLATGIYLFFSA